MTDEFPIFLVTQEAYEASSPEEMEYLAPTYDHASSLGRKL